MDGCELLIRWFDSSIGDYRCPDEFMPLFEVNGFVVKIDRFVFYRACEDISQAIEKGQKVYPVSVNVSRVTATQGDFVDYYAKIKRNSPFRISLSRLSLRRVLRTKITSISLTRSSG